MNLLNVESKEDRTNENMIPIMIQYKRRRYLGISYADVYSI